MDHIYLVEPTTKNLTPIESTTLADIGIKERQDLEQWVCNHPQVLGEDLFVITSEYDQFDKSNRRLDVLALDKEGSLVVVELKLELRHSLADQQAIRYAAFCSTMTMEDAVEAHASFANCSKDEATDAIRAFLGSEDLPELDNKPRIILAAGSLKDQELASTVLWLRTFGVDITCVELRPYPLPDGRICLAPRVIIPIPEAKEHTVRVEKKEAKKAKTSEESLENRRLWQEVAAAFNPISSHHKATGRARQRIMQVRIGHSAIHYEWMWRKGQDSLDVCLHFEWPDEHKCENAAEMIKKHERSIRQGIDLEFSVGRFGKKWTEARFRLPFKPPTTPEEIAPRAAEVMKLLMDRTLDIVGEIRKTIG